MNKKQILVKTRANKKNVKTPCHNPNPQHHMQVPVCDFDRASPLALQSE